MQLAEPVIYGGNKKGICEKGGRAAADQRDCAQLWFFLSRFPEEWDG